MEMLENSPMSWPLLLPELILCAFFLFCWWRLFTKAGWPGWTALIPLYNVYLYFRFIWGKGWWCLLLLVPLVNVFVWIRTAFLTAECFGKGLGFGFGVLLLPQIFLPILALGSARYRPHY